MKKFHLIERDGIFFVAFSDYFFFLTFPLDFDLDEEDLLLEVAFLEEEEDFLLTVAFVRVLVFEDLDCVFVTFLRVLVFVVFLSFVDDFLTLLCVFFLLICSLEIVSLARFDRAAFLLN